MAFGGKRGSLERGTREKILGKSANFVDGVGWLPWAGSSSSRWR